MTAWKQRQAADLCCYPRCGTPHLDGSNYCQRHLVDKLARNKKHMRARRAMKRVQLGLGL